MSAITIRPATVDDAAAICAIYNPYIASTTISFEEEPVSAADMAGRIADVNAAGLPWLVACRDGRPFGYAYATKWRARPAYRTSVESSVYLDLDEAGRGAAREAGLSQGGPLQRSGAQVRALGRCRLLGAAPAGLKLRRPGSPAPA